MNKCLKCKTETSNPKFCSKSCSNSLNNSLNPKIKLKIIFCKTCNKRIKRNSYRDKRRKYCSDKCNPFIIDWANFNYKDITGKRSYQKNSRIRELARNIYNKSNKPKYCTKCGYDKHYEICHIKPIHKFSEKSKISEINSLDNLIALCPNCHWELDHLK